LRRGKQSLGWNAADVDAGSTECLVHLDADGGKSKLRGANCSDVTTGATADDDDVGRCRLSHAIRSGDKHRGRILDQLFHSDEELHRVRPFNDSVIVLKGDVHHRANLDASIDRDGTILRFVKTEYSDLRIFDDGSRNERADHATVCNRERAAGEII